MVNIFLSSTWLDLQPERQAVESAIHRMRETKFVGMEYFGSRDETTQQTSLLEVDQAQVYVGIFGSRYGSGITEDEYRRARALKLPCFPYCKDESVIKVTQQEIDPIKIAKLNALKKDLLHAHTVFTFHNPEQLAAQVTADLHRWLVDSYLSPRFEQVVRGEISSQEAQPLLDAVKDWKMFPTTLLQRLHSAGYVIASGKGSVAIGGDVSGSVITTGSGNTISTGGVIIRGDSNVIGSKNKVSFIKNISTGSTLPEFSSLLSQIRKLLPTADLDKNDHEIVEHNLNSIEQEATRLKPRLLLIESSLKSLESIVGSTENLGATSIKLMPLLTQAIDIARQLFP